MVGGSTDLVLALASVGLPLASFVLVVSVTRWSRNASAWLSVAAMGLSFLCACYLLFDTIGGAHTDVRLTWIHLGSLALNVGVTVDPLASIMMLVVTSVGALVHLYSVGYMRDDPGTSRYFAYMSLFCASMIGLVLANSLLELYVFWELVGLCSYLLVGFWYERPAAAAAAKKAFVVTRLGDLGFLIGIVWIFAITGDLDLDAVLRAVSAGALGGTVLTIIALLIFSGAAGKSAQFPLHIWLPDAMEGPTPVSAVIHAATMVAAGVYLVARVYPLFSASPVALGVVATIGGITALLGATIALVQMDIKRVLAYSTISQLGYMMAGLGAGSASVGIFHLFNHAFFKALLFLAAGSVIHGLHGEQDVRRMGGLGRHMRLTATVFVVASLALSGIPPLSGFWSKDAIISAGFASGQPLLAFLLLLITFLTALYMFRLCFLLFFGPARTSAEPHEAPPNMAIPMLALVLASAVSWLVNAPFLGNPLDHFLGARHDSAPFDYAVASAGAAAGLLGIGVAAALYLFRWYEPSRISTATRPLEQALTNLYGMDFVYNWITRRVGVGLALLSFRFDAGIVDGVVNGVGWLAVATGNRLRRLETGRVQGYGLVMFCGLLVIAALMLLARVL